MVENNYFILNLNEPNQIANTSWIKPGQVIREVTLTTAGSMASIDFAAENNIAYVLFDAGWYGAEEDVKSDATTVTVDPARSKGPLDLPKVIEYANSKGVGILVYVNKKALHQQLDEILPLYKKWGIKGVKYGFVNVGDQYATAWLHQAVRKAAKYELMVDIHDEYRPTGYSRTYPNLLTQVVLAITIRQKDWDGRFSADNKQWAKTVPVSENPDAWGTDRNCYLAVNSHSGLVDLFTKLAREDARAHERRPSVLGRLKSRPPEAAAETVKKTKEPSL